MTQPTGTALTAVKALDAQPTGAQSGPDSGAVLRVGGYLVVWGDASQRDLHGEYFTPATDLGLEWYDRRPVLYQHGLDGALRTTLIGVIDTLRQDAVGIWAEATLTASREITATLWQRVKGMLERGLLAWSSGSLAHLVDVAADGQIRRWPIVEGSLTPSPAEPRRTSVQAIKSAYEALGLDMAKLQPDDADVTDPDVSMDVSMDASMSVSMSNGEITLNPEAANANYGTSQAAGPAGGPVKRLPTGSPADALKAAPRITVGSPFDSLQALDMLHGYMMLRAARGFQGVSEPYANALAYKVRRSGLTGIKSDELSHTANVGYGDKWAADLWSAELWRQAREENVILPVFRAIEMPSNPYELPIEGTDPTVHFVGETTDEADLVLSGAGNPIPDSLIGSNKQTLTAKKLALRVGFSAELAEDSIVPVLSMYREQAMHALTNAIDNVILNGDTTATATGNINSNDAQPAATTDYLAFNGLRHLGLVENTGNQSDCGTLSLANMRTARFLLANKYALNPNNLAWIVGGSTYAKLLSLDEFQTMDKAGPLATALTGQIGYADGIPVMVSAHMPLTQDDGFANATGNTKGQAVLVYRPGWIVGYRRRIAVSMDYLPYYDAYQMTATVRLALARLDDDVASVLYNITV